MTLGQRLQQQRLQKGLTQPELARRTGIAQANLSNIEKGKRDPSLLTLRKICFALGVPAWEIVRAAEQAPTGLSLKRTELEKLAKVILGSGAERPRAVSRELVKALRQIFSIERGVSDKELDQSWVKALGVFLHRDILTLRDRVNDERLRTS